MVDITRALSPSRQLFEEDPKRITRRVQPISATQIGNTNTTVYTANTDADFLVRSLWVANTTGTAATLSGYLVPSAGSASAANQFLNGYSVVANTLPIQLCHDATLRLLLQPGMSLVMVSGTDDALTVGGWGQDFLGGEV